MYEFRRLNVQEIKRRAHHRGADVTRARNLDAARRTHGVYSGGGYAWHWGGRQAADVKFTRATL